MTIAYVAPQSLKKYDERYAQYIRQIGGPECHAKVLATQRAMLEHRAELIERVLRDAVTTGATYTNVDETVEFAVLGVPFVFWQYGMDPTNNNKVFSCDYFVGPNASVDQWYAFLESTYGFASDSGVSTFFPYYFQAYRQLGFPGDDYEGLADLMHSTPPADVATEAVGDLQVTYEPAAVADVGEWVRNECSHILFVYGSTDPWTAGQFEQGGDCKKVTTAAGAHSAGFWSMTDTQRAEANGLVEQWLVRGNAKTKLFARGCSPLDCPREQRMPSLKIRR